MRSACLLRRCGAVLAIVRRRYNPGILSSCRGDSGGDAADATLTVVGHRRGDRCCRDWRRSLLRRRGGCGVGICVGQLGGACRRGPLVLAWCKGLPDLRRRRDLAKFLAGACVAGPLVGGLIGGTLSAVLNGASWATAVAHWWAGDGIGVLVVGAPILLWAKQSHILRIRLPETAAVLGVTALLSFAALWWQAPLALPLLPVMVWAALRLDVIGTALAGAVMAFTVNYMTGTGHGVFMNSTSRSRSGWRRHRCSLR